MKDIKLSPRLESILGALGVVKTLADVGCDHGFISIAAVLRGRCENAIAMDINEGPLKSAKTNAELYGAADAVNLRLSDGLEKLEPGEADGIIIAGMGGLLIRDILTRGQQAAKAAKRIVLSPQSDIPKVRSYLLSNGFVIEDEECLIDEEKFYFIMVVRPDSETLRGAGEENEKIDTEGSHCAAAKYPFGELGINFGGILLEKRHPILLKYLKKRLSQIDSILSKDGLMGTPRYEELSSEKEMIERACEILRMNSQ